ncbi:MAG: ABC transporter ATP-binding protein [Oligoflexus sp.]
MNLWQFAKTFARPLWPWYLAGMIFLALTNFITLQIPQLAKTIVNAFEKAEITDHLSQLAWTIIALGFLQILVRSLSRILIFWPGRKIEETSKSFLFARTMQLPQKFFDRYGMGDLISRLSNDLGQIRVFFAFAILQILNMSFLGLFTIVMMLSIHVELTLLCLAPIGLMLILTKFMMPALARYSRENQDAVGRLTNKVTESFTNVHVLKANAAEDTFLKRTEVENLAVYQTNIKVIIFRTLFFPLLTSLTGISQLLVLGYGGFQVMNEQITIGDILAFNIYLSYLAFPLTSIGIVLSIYQRSKTALQRITPIIDHQVEAATLSTTSNPTLLAKAALLEIKNLTYFYPDDEKSDRHQTASLKNISLQIFQGQKIGLCGPIGSGKSTILRLISRLYDPPADSIYWKGRDILSFEPHELRTHIGYGLQEVHLFSDSIRNNLAFGLNPKPSMEALQKAASDAQITDEIAAFDEGWETQVGEKGIRLSGGQKQRLALARLFLRDLDLLLLDDVLSAVDNQTEARLIKRFEESHNTILIASHRSSVLKGCDLVIYLRDGQLIDQGRFEELAEKFPELREERDVRPDAHE